jgi:hypothetical protein
MTLDEYADHLVAGVAARDPADIGKAQTALGDFYQLAGRPDFAAREIAGRYSAEEIWEAIQRAAKRYEHGTP